ncbi:hypothetical protein [Rummeliibacillus sp. TYF005]|uniref:hypothetical protein n=1 Tax=Rummeliibacillus sp. TYF005 TaxID=2058214 RepID=UPI000F5251C2|nr:hypothetical protein [Rummeliibacillus sp. TYF005]RPJ93975.1 hypothetical protein CW357_17860 [Rummeliibacillus sp. TYF005]
MIKNNLFKVFLISSLMLFLIFNSLGNAEAKTDTSNNQTDQNLIGVQTEEIIKNIRTGESINSIQADEVIKSFQSGESIDNIDTEEINNEIEKSSKENSIFDSDEFSYNYQDLNIEGISNVTPDINNIEISNEIDSNDIEILSGSAGLYKQYIKGNYKIDITKIHTGWAGPWAETQNIKHVNIHIYKKNTKGKYTHKANYHISAKTKGTSVCYYIHETVKKKSWTNCMSGLGKAKAQAEMQSVLLKDMKTVTAGEIATTIAIVAGVVIIVWALWPVSAIGLAAV